MHSARPVRPLAAVLGAALIAVSLPLLTAAPAHATQVRPGDTTPPRVTVRGVPRVGTPDLVLPVDRRGRQLTTGASSVRRGAATSPNVVSAAPQSTWVVSYGAGFDGRDEVKAAFQRAVDTWAHIVKSTVTIRVNADLEGDLGEGVLGYAGPTASCELDDGYVYPAALSNAIVGSDGDVDCGNVPANGGDGTDVTARFSNHDFYYFGSDPNGIAAAVCTPDPTTADPTPTPVAGSCYDFQTVVLHEIGHGLGMVSGTTVDAQGLGYLGTDAGVPYVYDAFTETSAGLAVQDQPNASRSLALAVTSDNLYWNGAEGAAADRGRDPQLYAPSDPSEPGATKDGWQEGSSYSHLDDLAYGPGDRDALMAPFLSPQDVLRDPGEIALGMFRDMGWVTPGLPGSRFTPMTPTRVLDTGSAVANGTVREITLTNRGVPANATAVVLNLTVDKPTSSNVLRAYPRGRRSTAAIPLVSNVNTNRGDTRANLATVPIGLGGRVRLYSTGGAARLVADLAGYYAPDSTDADGGFTSTSSPQRVMDTRSGLGVPRAPLGAGGVVDLDLSGSVPSTATAVTLAVAGVAPSTNTYLSVYPTGSSVGTSSINLLRRVTTANQVIVKLGPGSRVRFRNFAGSTNVIADLAGWYDPTTSGGQFRPTRPTRVIDTRETSPLGQGVSREINLRPAAVAGVPLNATSVVANLTGVLPSTGTYLTAYPSGAAVPFASNLNLQRRQTAASHVTVGLSAGRLKVRNNQGTTNVILDVAGWFGPA